MNILEDPQKKNLEDINIIDLNLNKNSNIFEIKGIEIILMNENSFIEFKLYINYDLINNYINLNSDKKNNYIEENIYEFNQIYKLFKKRKMIIPNNINP